MAAKSNKEIFNKEMEDYLSSIERDPSIEIPKKRKVEHVEDLVEEEHEPVIDEKSSRSLFQQFLEFVSWRKEKEHRIVEEEIEQEFEQELEELDEKENELREEEMEIKQRKKSLISRFMHLFGLVRKDAGIDEDYDQEREAETLELDERGEILNDMKMLGRISVGMLKRLPKHELQTYKETDEFESFKEILKKYKIIK